MSRREPFPFASTRAVRDVCLCFHANRAARALAREFDDVFRPLGITSGQFSILNALNRAEPASIGEAAKFLVMDRTTLTAALKPLLRNGLISAHADPQDKRKQRIALTEAGHDRLRKSFDLWRRAHKKIEAELPRIDQLRIGLEVLAQRPRPARN